MKFGLFSLFDFFQDRQDEGRYYQDTLDLVIRSEQLGFDSVWLGEEHFYSFGICPSPQLFLTALARETTTLRLGTAISLLPFENPLRKAEDFAMLDILSNGRLDFGAGRGIIPKHFEGFRIPPQESQARYEEALAIIRQAWTQDSFSYQGKFWQVPELSLSPKPSQNRIHRSIAARSAWSRLRPPGGWATMPLSCRGCRRPTPRSGAGSSATGRCSRSTATAGSRQPLSFSCLLTPTASGRWPRPKPAPATIST